MSGEDILKVIGILFEYLIPTLKIFGGTLLFAIPLGMAAALLRMSKIKVISWIMRIYILIMRGTPLMLQVIVAYYAIPYIKLIPGQPEFMKNMLSVFDIASPDYMFNAVLFAFVLNYAAYFAEIFRGGIEAVPNGQREAAAALGFTGVQTFFRIILPQVIKRIVPATANEVITLVKDTSLANVVAYAEITLKAKQQMQNYSSLIPLFVAGAFYLAMAMILTFVFSFIEKKLDYYR